MSDSVEKLTSSHARRVRTHTAKLEAIEATIADGDRYGKKAAALLAKRSAVLDAALAEREALAVALDDALSEEASR